MYELALFAGAGGGILGGRLLGWRTVGAVEIDGYAREVLAARQNDGCLEPFPIWDDVRSFTKRNGACRRFIRALRKIRHDLIITGGFPCQDISVAGKGAGIDGERSGLWREFARIIREVRPRFVLVENSPALVSRGLGTVLGDLASMGYDAKWGVLGAVHAGAPHRRERIWIVADTVCNGTSERLGGVSSKAGPKSERTRRRPRAESGDGGCDVRNPSSAGLSHGRSTPLAGCPPESQLERSNCDVPDTDSGRHSRNAEERGGAEHPQACGGSEDVSDADGSGREEQWSTIANGARHETVECGGWWATEPAICRMVDGVARGLDVHGVVTSRFVGRLAGGIPQRTKRIHVLGNGQVPVCVVMAWEILTAISERE